MEIRQAREIAEQEIIVEPGDRVQVINGADYIVARISQHELSLINLSDGNRYTSPVRTYNGIIRVYLSDLTNGNRKFRLVK